MTRLDGMQRVCVICGPALCIGGARRRRRSASCVLPPRSNASQEELAGHYLPAEAQQDQFHYVFEEWVHLQRTVQTSSKASVAFIRQLDEQGYLKTHNHTALFFRTCIDSSVASRARLAICARSSRVSR